MAENKTAEQQADTRERAILVAVVRDNQEPRQAEEFLDEPHVCEIVDSQFDSFIRRNVLRFDTAKYPMNAVGSVAHFFRKNLERAAERNGVRLGRILKSPIDALVGYHSKDL